jgi:hypothetical protein
MQFNESQKQDHKNYFRLLSELKKKKIFFVLLEEIVHSFNAGAADNVNENVSKTK